MKAKRLFYLLTIMTVLFGLLAIPASAADSVTVNSWSELVSAVKNSSYSEITLGSDIDAVSSASLQVNHKVTVDGAGHTIDGKGRGLFVTKGGTLTLKNAVITNAARTDKKKGCVVYVLMNIPYDKFYEGEGISGVDAVTSATLNKPRTGSLAGGSYHVNSDGSDITGVIYPVLVTDTTVLEGLNQITDESSVDITVTNRGVTSTTSYSGKDALFEAPSYSYYLLTDAPARYKTLTVDGEGNFSFSAVSGRATAVEGVTGRCNYYTHHNNYVEISLDGLTLGENENVSGVIVTFDDGTSAALRHIDGIWRKTQIGWADGSDVQGKTITGLKYVTPENVYTAEVSIFIKKCSDSTISAVFKTGYLLEVNGLPQDIINPLATVKDAEGKVIADQVPVANGTVACEKDAKFGSEYTVTVNSDNYAQMTASAVCLNRSTTGEGSEVKTYPVSCSDPENGSVSASSSRAASGSAVTVNIQQDTGYELDRLTVTDSNGRQIPITALDNGRYSFTMPDGPVTVQASFKLTDNSGSSYQDVAPTAWYAEAVDYVIANGLMNGVGNNCFGPDQNLTRAMLTAMLYRASGSPEVSGSNPFSDVPANTWYTDAVIWANANGVVLGFGSDFRPDENVTREQIAAMLMRYAEFRGWDVSQRAPLDGYSDQNSVIDWAVKCMQWAVAASLINGRGNDTLAPQASATRAEIAMILQRFFEKYE